MAREENLKKMASQLLDDTFKAIPAGADIQSAGYADVRKTVEGISGELAAKDVTPSETAMFIFSMKESTSRPCRAMQDKERVNDATVQ